MTTHTWYKTKSEAFDAGNGQIVVYVARDISKSGSKEFSFVKTYNELLSIIKSEKCVYEMVSGKWHEMYDFDGKDINVSEQSIIDNFIKCRNQISNEKIHIKSCSTADKISLHFIINTSVFADHNAMRNRWRQMISNKELIFADRYDGSIYTKDRLIRTIYSDKTFQNRPFRNVSNSNDVDFFVTVFEPMTKIKYTMSRRKETTAILEKFSLLSFKYDREIRPNIVRVKRLNPSACMVCQRVHDNDNAWINLQTLDFGCFRASDEKREPSSVHLDSDLMRLSKSKLMVILREFAISETDIQNIISRSSV